MNDIYYLIHTTNKYNEEWKELRTSPIEDYEDQFPGVYFTLITKDNIHKEKLYPGNKQILIFSKRLLEQKNYHINLRDYNGYISENNTYFPWNLDAAVKKISEDANINSNEVVFHDPIPMKYLCVAIKKLSSNISNNNLLPNVPIQNEVEPDLSKEPFYCYPLEKNYTGMNPLSESSSEFFMKMAKMCGVDNQLPTNEIINQISQKIPDLYMNRNKQQIDMLKTTGGMLKTTGCKSKKRRKINRNKSLKK